MMELGAEGFSAGGDMPTRSALTKVLLIAAQYYKEDPMTKMSLINMSQIILYDIKSKSGLPSSPSVWKAR